MKEIKDMTENHDGADPDFEDRVRGLFEGDGAARGVSVTSVIAGARKRRVRRRATATGSSVAVLGVAAGVVTFGMHPAAAPAPGVTGTEVVGTVTPGPRTTNTESPAAPAGTCSASVTGPVPALTPVKDEGIEFEVVTGQTAHIPWAVQIHAFPDWQSWLDWRATQTNPPVPSTVSHVLGPPALIRATGRPEFTMSSVPHYSFGFAGTSLGGGGTGAAKIMLLETWVSPTIDHLCLQFAQHADFVPVYRIQSGAYAVFGYPAADEPQKVIGYDRAGQVVATSTGSEGGLLPPDGK